MARVSIDYYEVLGVARDASPKEVKRAFLKKARAYHPDVCKDADAEAHFKEVNEAYSVLGDERRRANYDRFGDPDGPGGFGGMGDIFDGFGGMADILSDFFGGGRAQGQGRGPGHGRTMQARVSVTLEEAAVGTQRAIAYDRLAVCEDCHGSGSADGEPPVPCVACGGSGYQISYQQTLLGRMQTQVPCPHCGGTGQVIEHPCELCQGQGRVPTRETVEVDVPVGVATGERVRVRGMGEAGFRGEPSGDLVVEVLVEEDPRFRRLGDDLVAPLVIDALEAIVGCEVEMEGILPEERLVMAVGPGALEGTQVRAEGRGMPRRAGGRGDLVGVVSVRAVDDLDGDEVEELRAMSARHHGRMPRDASPS